MNLLCLVCESRTVRHPAHAGLHNNRVLTLCLSELMEILARTELRSGFFCPSVLCSQSATTLRAAAQAKGPTVVKSRNLGTLRISRTFLTVYCWWSLEVLWLTWKLAVKRDMFAYFEKSPLSTKRHRLLHSQYLDSANKGQVGSLLTKWLHSRSKSCKAASGDKYNLDDLDCVQSAAPVSAPANMKQSIHNDDRGSCPGGDPRPAS